MNVMSAGLLTLLMSSSVALAGEESNAPVANNCQLNALTFANVDFANSQGQLAQQECQNLLTLVKDNNQNDCQVKNINVQGQRRKRARLRFLNQVQGNGLAQTIAALQQLIQGNNLLGDRVLGLQLVNNGQCAQ